MHNTLYSSRIDIPSDRRIQIIDRLNQTLATTLDLKTQVKQAHLAVCEIPEQSTVSCISWSTY